jgi:uncharacterized protein
MTTAATSVVERMLGHAAAGDWDALHGLLDPGFVIVEPASLPWGGEHHGVEGYVALMQRIGTATGPAFDLHGVHELSDRCVLLRMSVCFTNPHSARTLTMPVLELLTVDDGRVTRSEVFLSDAAALLDLIAPTPA